MTSNTGSDLDSLIHSLEFENQQYVKMIEKENQRNQYLESQEEEKMTAITELQARITSLEADTKSNHKQLVHNKNTLESLKKTKSVLQAHRDALNKQLDMLQFEHDEQQREFEETLQTYENTWTDYEAKYKSLALYKTLLEVKSELAQSQAKLTRWQQQKNELQGKMQAAQDELDFRDWQRFCIKIKPSAEKKVSTASMKEELLAAVREKEALQAKLREISENNTTAVGTASLEPAQNMETDETETETSSKEASEDSMTEEDKTMMGAGDGGDTSSTLIQNGGEAETQNPSDVPPSDRTFTVSSGTDERLPAVVPLPATSREPTHERTVEDSSVTTKEFRQPERFEPSNTSTPVVSGARSSVRKPPQLTSTPKMPLPLSALTVPRISLGLPPQESIKPQRVSVPLLNIPKPPPKSASSRIPTIRSAVSSLLSCPKLSAEKVPQPPVPVMPKVLMPRTPLITPPPSPAVPLLPEMNMTGHRALKSGASKMTSVSALAPRIPIPLASAARLPSAVSGRGQELGSIPRPAYAAPPSPVVPASAAGSHLPRLVRPAGRQPSSSYSRLSTAPTPPPLSPVLTPSGDGDAPPVHNAGQVNSHVSKENSSEAKLMKQDEDMELDAEGAGESQGSQVRGTPEGNVGVSQGQSSNSFSPFDLQKHQQKLMEIHQADDSIGFQHRPLFSTVDSATADKTASSSSVFNMGFAAPTEPTKQPAVSLFSSTSSPPTSSGSVRFTSPTRDERGGSFFSFDSMDTGDNSGSLSVLSMFGNSSNKPEPESAFSFNFGSVAADSAKDSGFSISFGGGGGGGEVPTGSIFSLF